MKIPAVLGYLIAPHHFLTPIAIIRMAGKNENGSFTFRCLYVFGIKIAYWTCQNLTSFRLDFLVFGIIVLVLT